MEDVIGADNQIAPHITAVVHYNAQNEQLYCDCFSTNALERWLLERDLHPLTREPISEYQLIDIS